MAAALLAGGSALWPAPPPALSPATAVAAAPAGQCRPVTILVSIDGFRPDHLTRGATPILSRLAAEGVTMIPSFSSETFPNHWTLVTGLVPDHHGIVGNAMEEAARPGETFTMVTDDPLSAADPIWVTAQNAGQRTATEFWPGANVGWRGARERPGDATVGGERPQDWHQYAGAVTSDQRADAVIDWLRRPAAYRPRFVTLYFDAVDHAGHAFGPDSPPLRPALAEVERAVGRLLDGLAELNQPANLVIVADHGMAATSTARTVALDRIAKPGDYRLFDSGPYATLYAQPGRTAALEAALLRPHPHMQCWRKRDIPARLRFGSNPRVPPYLCLAEAGWEIVRTAPTETRVCGNHGYDNAARELRALYIAHGPAIRGGRTLPPFQNMAVEPLLRELLGLPPGSGLDSDDTPFRDVLVCSGGR